MITAQHTERWTSAISGAALVVWGANRLLTRDRQPLGALLAATGAGLIVRATRTDTRARLGGSRGTIVEESVCINRAPEQLYGFWRELQLLPTVIPELMSVRVIDDRRSCWVARGPAGWRAEWYADIINDIPNELIAWRTVASSNVVSAGSVHFEPTPFRRGTIVRVKLQYDPPAGKAGAAVARLFGSAPSHVLREGLRRFKQLMETGEIPTIDGQPRGAR